MMYSFSNSLLCIYTLISAGYFRYVNPQCSDDQHSPTINIDVVSFPSKSNISGEYWVYDTGVELRCNSAGKNESITWFYLNKNNQHWTPVPITKVVKEDGPDLTHLLFMKSPEIKKSKKLSDRLSAHYFCTSTAEDGRITISRTVTIRYPYYSKRVINEYSTLGQGVVACHFCKSPGIPLAILEESAHWLFDLEWHKDYLQRALVYPEGSHSHLLFCHSALDQRDAHLFCEIYNNTAGKRLFGDIDIGKLPIIFRELVHAQQTTAQLLNETGPEPLEKLPAVERQIRNRVFPNEMTSFSVTTLGEEQGTMMSCTYRDGAKTVHQLGEIFSLGNRNFSLSVLCCSEAKQFTSNCYTVNSQGLSDVSGTGGSAGSGSSATLIILLVSLLSLLVITSAAVAFYFWKNKNKAAKSKLPNTPGQGNIWQPSINPAGIELNRPAEGKLWQPSIKSKGQKKEQKKNKETSPKAKANTARKNAMNPSKRQIIS